MAHVYDVLVVGGGAGGYTAALYAARAGLDTLVLEQLCAGGQMALAEAVENYPGFVQAIDGFTLGERMREGAERAGAKTELAQAVSVSLDGEIKRVETNAGTRLGKTVIVATGCVPKKLGLAGEDALVGNSVSYCAVCDAHFYAGKDVAVIGGGNTALTNALLLSRLCKSVTVIHRRDKMRAAKAYQQRLVQAENVRLLRSTVVCALLHDKHLTGLRLRDVQTGQERTLKCDGVFVCIGQTPQTQLLQGALALDENGYIIADETTKTALAGVFAVGDVRTKPLRQIVTATADGAVAAQCALEYLQ